MCLLSLKRCDAALEIGRSRQRQAFGAHAELGARGCPDLAQRLQRAEPELVAQRFRVARIVHVFVLHRVDVAAAPLQEQGERAVAQGVLDRFGCEAGDVGRVAAPGHALDGMDCIVVNHRQRPAVLSVETQQADLGVDRPGAGNLLLRRRRIGVAHVGHGAVLQFQPSILRDSVFVTAPGSGLYGHQIPAGAFHNVDGSLLDIGAHDAVAMAGVDEDV